MSSSVWCCCVASKDRVLLGTAAHSGCEHSEERWGAAGSPGNPQSSEMDPGSLGQQMHTKRLGDSLIPAKWELGTGKSEVWAGDCFHFLLDVTSPSACHVAQGASTRGIIRPVWRGWWAQFELAQGRAVRQC